MYHDTQPWLWEQWHFSANDWQQRGWMIVADDGDNEDGGDGGDEEDDGGGGFSGRRPAGEQEPPGVAGLPCSIWMVVSIAEFLYDRDADQDGDGKSRRWWWSGRWKKKEEEDVDLVAASTLATATTSVASRTLASHLRTKRFTPFSLFLYLFKTKINITIKSNCTFCSSQPSMVHWLRDGFTRKKTAVLLDFVQITSPSPLPKGLAPFTYTVKLWKNWEPWPS